MPIVGTTARSLSSSGRASDVTCEASYDWMLNAYQQNPCQVASYLGGICEPGTEFQVSELGPGEYYPGPSAQQSNPCRCSSVLYSLLSACAACQSHKYLSWSVYNNNCPTIYSGQFIGKIPSTTAVEPWAYQNVTKYNTFNISLAQEVAANRSASIESTTKLLASQDTDNTADHGKNTIVWGVIGAVCFVFLAIGLLVGLNLWRKSRGRPQSVAPSAAYQHRYAPLGLGTKSSQNTLLPLLGTVTPGGRGSMGGHAPTPASSSRVSLPSLLYQPPEPSQYSPAVESSDMFTSQGGHSDRTVSLSHFTRLVPQRRAGGRW
ncbi:hypothetical protein C8R46DRAFT_142896 [Mycena filopes]|nr:hypothetical protein C8R46DRAFT_142896 [Mycena filopes]